MNISVPKNLSNNCLVIVVVYAKGINEGVINQATTNIARINVNRLLTYIHT